MTILTGLFTLGRDAEQRSTNSGDQVTTLSLGYNYGRKGDDGKRPTQWVRATVWGNLGVALAPHLTKGKQVNATLEDVHIRTWDKDGGGTGHALEGKVLQIEMARGQRQESAAPPPAPAPQRRPAPAPAPRAGGSSGFDDMDDDVPFADPLARRGLHLAL